MQRQPTKRSREGVAVVDVMCPLCGSVRSLDVRAPRVVDAEPGAGHAAAVAQAPAGSFGGRRLDRFEPDPTMWLG